MQPPQLRKSEGVSVRWQFHTTRESIEHHNIVRVSKSHRGGDSTPRASLSHPTILLRVSGSQHVGDLTPRTSLSIPTVLFRVSKSQYGGDFTPRTGSVVTTALWSKIYTNMGIFLFHEVLSLYYSTVVKFQDHIVV